MCDSQKAVNTSTPRLTAIAETSRTRRLLPMPGGPTTPTTRAVALDCAVQQAFNGGHLPPPTDQIRLDTLDEAMPFAPCPTAAGPRRAYRHP